MRHFHHVTTDLRPVTQRNKFSASAIEDVSMMGIAAEQLACLTIASCSFILTGGTNTQGIARLA
ncbi:integral membrane protein [Pyricularia oryzae]|nr:integral membrane protein [Pyricularia oryzae]KAI7913648.1 integral membrane protein [Pyricularia oryzae]